jgi:hypothetical protein
MPPAACRMYANTPGIRHQQKSAVIMQTIDDGIA